MQLNTKYFGTISYLEKEIIHFPEGLFGFEEFTDFLPISFQESNDAMISLQSIKDEQLAFILMNPFYLLETYNPILPPADLKMLDFSVTEELSYYVICVVKEAANESTVNLKCPIIVNSTNRLARQVILDSSNYTFRHKLADLSKKGV